MVCFKMSNCDVFTLFTFAHLIDSENFGRHCVPLKAMHGAGLVPGLAWGLLAGGFGFGLVLAFLSLGAFALSAHLWLLGCCGRGWDLGLPFLLLSKHGKVFSRFLGREAPAPSLPDWKSRHFGHASADKHMESGVFWHALEHTLEQERERTPLSSVQT